jgi:hypothetical protein
LAGSIAANPRLAPPLFFVAAITSPPNRYKMQRCSNRARQRQFKSLTWVMMIVGVTETGAKTVSDWDGHMP